MDTYIELKNLHCKFKGHEDKEIIGFCIDKKCSEKNKFVCSECFFDSHSMHKAIRIKEMLSLIQTKNDEYNQYYKEEQRLLEIFDKHELDQKEKIIKLKIDIINELDKKANIFMDDLHEKYKKLINQWVIDFSTLKRYKEFMAENNDSVQDSYLSKLSELCLDIFYSNEEEKEEEKDEEKDEEIKVIDENKEEIKVIDKNEEEIKVIDKNEEEKIEEEIEVIDKNEEEKIEEEIEVIDENEEEKIKKENDEKMKNILKTIDTNFDNYLKEQSFIMINSVNENFLNTLKDLFSIHNIFEWCDKKYHSYGFLYQLTNNNTRGTKIKKDRTRTILRSKDKLEDNHIYKIKFKIGLQKNGDFDVGIGKELNGNFYWLREKDTISLTNKGIWNSGNNTGGYTLKNIDIVDLEICTKTGNKTFKGYVNDQSVCSINFNIDDIYIMASIQNLYNYIEVLEYNVSYI